LAPELENRSFSVTKKRRSGESTSEPEKERDQTSEISILGWFGKKKEEKKRPKRNREKGAKYIRTSISIGKPSTAKVPETGGCHPVSSVYHPVAPTLFRTTLFERSFVRFVFRFGFVSLSMAMSLSLSALKASVFFLYYYYFSLFFSFFFFGYQPPTTPTFLPVRFGALNWGGDWVFGWFGLTSSKGAQPALWGGGMVNVNIYYIHV